MENAKCLTFRVRVLIRCGSNMRAFASLNVVFYSLSVLPEKRGSDLCVFLLKFVAVQSSFFSSLLFLAYPDLCTIATSCRGKMADQKRSDFYVVFTLMLCDLNFCVWYVVNLEFTS